MNSKLGVQYKTEECTDGFMLFSPLMMHSCVYILHNLLQEVLNFRLAHNGLFTPVLVCPDLSSCLRVIFLYSQMSKNPVFRGCSYNCLSK